MKNFSNALLINILLICAAINSACTSQQLGQIGDVLGNTPLTSAEVSRGLKEALSNGTINGVSIANQQNGYLNNPRLKIPFPADAKKVENTLRDLGLGSEVDKFVVSLNRGAEKAAAEAKPIFLNAIKQLTIQDAFAILKGDDNAATNFLKRTTSAQLKQKFLPIMEQSLSSVNATRYYSDLVSRYNRIPLVQPVNPDLTDYATDKAIEGLFLLVADEEARIRENPLARTSALLKKVFAAQD